jgi:hypothetical protein
MQVWLSCHSLQMSATSYAYPNGARLVSPTFTDKDNEDLVRQAIKVASDAAGSDSEFVQLLRTSYFAKHPTIGRQLPTLQPARLGARATSRAGGE